VLKFSKTGQFLLQIGTPGKTDGGPDSQTFFNGPSAVAVDDAANEAYIADSGNRRVVVVDATTGAYKRHWFGSGDKASSPAPAAYTPTGPAVRGFRDVSCIDIAKDGLVYVCDSASNRVQVFQKNGTFVKEGIVKAGTGGLNLNPAGGAQGATYSFGSAWDVAFSNDAQQRFLYVADGMNKTVWILDRNTLAPLSRVGGGGRYPGLFYAVASVAVDSRGNLYTGEESDGKRVQKFINRGMGAPRPLN
jgi:DNA-binding beta-propeller fold protein YncE